MKDPSKAVVRMGRSGIREIFDLANSLTDVIHLEMGEPSFPTPAHVRRAAAEAADAGHTRYTPNAGIPELRDALAEKVRRRNGIDVGPDQVVVTVGGIAALFASLLTLCDPGDEVALSDPAWPNYRMICELLNLTPRYYPLRPQDGMVPKAELVEPVISERTKALVVNSPANPTGAVIDVDAWRDLLQLACDLDLWVISDEVYDEIVFDRPVATSAAAVGPAERIITVFSFSKTYAMTGWRVGYAVVPPGLAPLLVKTQEPTTACVNAPAQVAALAAVTGSQDCVAEMRDAYRTRRDRVAERLSDAGIGFVLPSGAFYVWVDVAATGLTGSEFARRLLVERRVAVTPGAAFGAAGRSFVRLSLASPSEELYVGVDRLAESIEAWKP